MYHYDQHKEVKKSRKGLLIFLSFLVSIVVMAIVISSTFDAPIEEEVSTTELGIGRFFLYVKYYVLEFIAFLFMQK